MKQNRAWSYQTASNTVQLTTPEVAVLKPGQVLVENAAIGINPVDWKFIHGNPINWSEGHIPGVDGSGVVVAIGEGVDPELVGTRVSYHAALKNNGSFAQFTAVDAPRMMRLPKALSHEMAAALPCPMLTAWQATQKLPTRTGASALINGLGAVNKLVVQMLVARGFEVDVVSRSADDAALKALGIRRCYRSIEEVDTRYFAAVDATSSDNAAKLVPLLKANGHIVCIQGRVDAPIDPGFTRNISYHEVALGALHDFGDDADWHALMSDGEALMQQVVEGKLFVAEPSVEPFEAFQKALELSETTKQKMVVSVHG